HHGHDHHGHDHNLRAAYLHVLADTLTSFLAIIALLASKFYGWNWMDPIMGIIGAVLITKWSIGLLKQSGNVLMDRQGPDLLIESVETAIKSTPNTPEIVDLHIWSIGPNIYSAAITVVSNKEINVGLIKSEMQKISGIAHTTVEIHLRGRH
ncbi:MAG: cation transporter, partial [Verrucomicrobiales bacterium]|nr:cation transporter [Verrucomicrobiales bacterium]